MNRAATISNSQLALIHMLAQKAGLDADGYRDFMMKETSESSAKALSFTAAGRVIDRLRDLAGDPGPNGSVAGLDSPLGKKLRALWIAAHNLGIVRDRTDRAMLAYLARQTGVSHTRFLSDAGDGNKAVEGLKSWLAREGKVEWPVDSRDAVANKHAILNAQWMRLIEIGAVKPIVEHKPLAYLVDYANRVTRKNGWDTLEAHHYDEVQAALGRKLRGALARRAGGQS
jgi:hypothetical protein